MSVQYVPLATTRHLATKLGQHFRRIAGIEYFEQYPFIVKKSQYLWTTGLFMRLHHGKCNSLDMLRWFNIFTAKRDCSRIYRSLPSATTVEM